MSFEEELKRTITWFLQKRQLYLMLKSITFFLHQFRVIALFRFLVGYFLSSARRIFSKFGLRVKSSFAVCHMLSIFRL